MKTDNLKSSINPTQEQVKEIEKWLTREWNLKGEGFYCKWNNILSSFEENQLAIVSYKNKTVGFASWYDTSNFTVTILMVEIKPDYRNKGFGRELINQLFDFFMDKDIYAVDLQCSPATSEPLWRRFGFIDFPEKEEQGISSGKSNKRLYQTLVPQLNTTTEIGKNEVLELWNMEPHIINGDTSTWKWKLEFKEGTRELIRPIIHPCDNEWRIRWKVNDIVITDTKVKYFSKEPIKFGEFLIIKVLPEPS